VLPFIWTLFALSAVAAVVMVAAYWLDVQDRSDLSFRARVAWSAGALLFPISIPVYAFAGGAGWPVGLRIASFVPAVALALLGGFATGAFR
jgi:hypothetical protein